jgi:molybdenum cofactor cytidylyltransferase
MGQAKLLLPWGETSILGYLIKQWRALGAEQITVVHAAEDRLILTELDRLVLPPKDRIANPNVDRGMFSSILCAAGWRGWDARLTHWGIVLGDQPHLRPGALEHLVEFTKQHPEQVCQPVRNGKTRHPVILPKRIFSELAESSLADLKEFLQTKRVAGCPVDDPGLDLDIDRPEDYQRALVLAGFTSQ